MSDGCLVHYGKACPKVSRWESEKYKAWIRTQPPIHPRQAGDGSDIVATHYRIGADGGEALKPSDIWLLPRTVFQHNISHTIEEIEPDEAMRHIIKLMTKYLTEKGIK